MRSHCILCQLDIILCECQKYIYIIKQSKKPYFTNYKEQMNEDKVDMHAI